MKPAFFKGFSPKRGFQRACYVASRLLCLVISKALFSLRIEGQEHIPDTGAAIVAANHVSFLDPVIIGVAVPRPLHFMAKEELFRFGPVGRVLRTYQAFPVGRGKGDLLAIKQAVSLLQQGELVLIFPEGTRGDGRRLGPAKPGIGLVAARSRAPVVPVFHRGTERALPRGAWIPRPRPIMVKFGRPLRFEGAEADGEPGHHDVSAFSQTIMETIAALKAGSEGGASVSGDRASVTEHIVATEREDRGDHQHE
jgi:1-acyl-sn-glycerol-3-phosphate acyltransferase